MRGLDMKYRPSVPYVGAGLPTILLKRRERTDDLPEIEG